MSGIRASDGVKRLNYKSINEQFTSLMTSRHHEKK